MQTPPNPKPSKGEMMGEQAELLINGDCCSICGCNFEDEGSGYPRTCNGCGGKDGDTL